MCLHTRASEPLDADHLADELESFGVPRGGGVVVVHSSLSSLGPVVGGAGTVVEALLRCLGETGTVVVPTFTPQVRDPHPRATEVFDPEAEDARRSVPLFHDGLPTPMGVVPNAVLARPERLRSDHPQASVAAIGPHAAEITAGQPLAYALGRNSPFERMYALNAHILLLGVGHNRNSFLHYAESLVARHRRKLRRFPLIVRNERLWVEAPDVGDDNGTYFPRLGAEAESGGLIRTRTIGAAACQLMPAVPFIDAARLRLEQLLALAGTP